MSPSKWIHCNKCYTTFQSNVKFYLSECSHIICCKCVPMFEKNNQKCLICNKPSKILLLSKDLKSEVRMYFNPMEELISVFSNIINFQVNNQLSLLEHAMKNVQKAKQMVYKYQKQIEDLKRENARLRTAMNRSMNTSDGSRSFTTSTPRNQIRPAIQQNNLFDTSSNTLLSSIYKSPLAFPNVRSTSAFPLPFDNTKVSHPPHHPPEFGRHTNTAANIMRTGTSSSLYLNNSSRYRPM